MASRADLISQADEQRAAAATPKIRSRKDGAAVPLDDVDRKPAQPDAGELPDRAAALSARSPSSRRCPRRR